MHGFDRIMSGDRSRAPQQGVTLIELMTVLSVIAILVSLATAMYSRSIARARAVEGEIAVREVDRLEATYYIDQHVYTGNLTQLGFTMAGGLRYHTVSVWLGADGSPLSYAVVATPLRHDQTDGWILRKYTNGRTTLDRVAGSGLIAGGAAATELSHELFPPGSAAPGGSRVVHTPTAPGIPSPGA